MYFPVTSGYKLYVYQCSLVSLVFIIHLWTVILLQLTHMDTILYVLCRAAQQKTCTEVYIDICAVYNMKPAIFFNFNFPMIIFRLAEEKFLSWDLRDKKNIPFISLDGAVVHATEHQIHFCTYCLSPYALSCMNSVNWFRSMMQKRSRGQQLLNFKHCYQMCFSFWALILQACKYTMKKFHWA